MADDITTTEARNLVSTDDVGRARKAWLDAAAHARALYAEQAAPGGYGDPMAERAANLELEHARAEVQQRLLEYQDARESRSARERTKADEQARKLSRASFVLAFVVGVATVANIVTQIAIRFFP